MIQIFCLFSILTVYRLLLYFFFTCTFSGVENIVNNVIKRNRSLIFWKRVQNFPSWDALFWALKFIVLEAAPVGHTRASLITEKFTIWWEMLKKSQQEKIEKAWSLSCISPSQWFHEKPKHLPSGRQWELQIQLTEPLTLMIPPSPFCKPEDLV